MQKLKFLVILLALFLTSCEASVIVGPIVNGIIYWKNGEAYKYYPFKDYVVLDATKKAVRELGFKIEKEEKLEKGKAYFLVVSNDKFKIRIEQVETGITRLKIRVNFWGDKEYAELIFKKVDERLGFE